LTISLEQHSIVLSGRCGVEEVETLAAHLETHPDLPVDLGGAAEIHTALWQALIFFRPKVTKLPSVANMSEKLLSIMAEKLANAG
jgi:hypothetical protein